MIVKRTDQRNTSDRSSAHAALNSNISERVFETHKYEGRFGKIRDEGNTLAMKKLMPESLLHYRFRGTTLPYEELLTALKNISIDKVTTHAAPAVKKIDTSAPMDIGMAAGTDGEETFEEGYGKASELAVQAVSEGTGGKGGWNGGKSPSWSVQKYFSSGKVEKGANRAKKGRRKVAKATPQFAGAVGNLSTSRRKGRSWNRSLNAVEEDRGDISEEEHEDDDELHAWCLLKESDEESAHESLVSVDNKSCAAPRKVIEGKDIWVNIRATTDTGAAGHVMPAKMFPRVKLKDLGEETIPIMKECTDA